MSWQTIYSNNFTNGTQFFGDKIQESFSIKAQQDKKPYMDVGTHTFTKRKSAKFSFFSFKQKNYKDSFIKEIKNIKGTIPVCIDNCDDNYVSYNDDFYIRVCFRDGKVRFWCYSFDFELAEQVSDIAKKHINFSEKQNSNVYTLQQDGSSLAVNYLGSFKKPINKNNYSQNVLSKLDDCLKEIKKKNPKGRLSVLCGPPGTGKTYLLRSIINSVKDAVFISLSPEIFIKYDAGVILNALSSFKDSKIVLLIEDADAMLSNRKHNSENVVSNVLNFTDGFMGECLDTHLVCTTNIEKLDFDRAYLRRGRLNKFIEIGLLSPREAQKAYDALKIKGKPKYTFTEEMLLTDVYAKADPETDIEENYNKPRRIGFGNFTPSKNNKDLTVNENDNMVNSTKGST